MLGFTASTADIMKVPFYLGHSDIFISLMRRFSFAVTTLPGNKKSWTYDGVKTKGIHGVLTMNKVMHTGFAFLVVDNLIKVSLTTDVAVFEAPQEFMDFLDQNFRRFLRGEEEQIYVSKL